MLNFLFWNLYLSFSGHIVFEIVQNFVIFKIFNYLKLLVYPEELKAQSLTVDKFLVVRGLLFIDSAQSFEGLFGYFATEFLCFFNKFYMSVCKTLKEDGLS